MKVKTGDVNDTDNYLWVKSKAKALKENCMNGLLSQRFEEGLQSIQEGIQKKGEDPGKKAGIYFLRTTLNIEDEKVFWSIYNTIREIKCIATTMENIDNEMISIRQCTEPNQKVKDIYKMMKYKPVPFYRKKSVDLPTEIFKNDSS